MTQQKHRMVFRIGSQEDRITAEAGGHLWTSSRITPCSEQGQTPQVPPTRVGCWRSPWVKTPHCLWTTCSHCLIILSKRVFLHSYRIVWVLVCAHFFWSFSGHHWAEPGLHLLLPPQSGTYTYRWDPLSLLIFRMNRPLVFRNNIPGYREQTTQYNKFLTGKVFSIGTLPVFKTSSWQGRGKASILNLIK